MRKANEFSEYFRCIIDSKAIISELPNLQKKLVDLHNDTMELEDEFLSYTRSINPMESDELALKKISDANTYTDEYLGVLNKLSYYFSSKEVEASYAQNMLLTGDAGIGKSHLLCDVTFKRLDEKLPTIFVLGQHYSGGNPTEYICSTLCYPPEKKISVLGALDSFAESYETKFLIIVDAINEGRNSIDWYDNISNLINDLSPFKNLSLVISCRSTYKDRLIPDYIKELIEYQHKGFRGVEQKAVEAYLLDNKIVLPNVPILAPEFSNPLFLKTVCEAMKMSGESNFPKGITGFIGLFNHYVKCVEKVIERERGYRRGEDVVNKSIEAITKLLLEHHFSGVPISIARTVIDEIDPKNPSDNTLFDSLIDEGLFSEDVSYSDNTKRGEIVIRFTYE